MVVHNYYPLGEIRVQREAKALIDCGFEVDVICLRRPGEPPRDAEYNVQIYRLPVKRHKQYGAFVQLFEYLAFFLLVTWQLLKLYLKQGYATVQIHNLPDFLVFSALLPKFLGARVILDLHDLMPEFYAARFGSNLNVFPVKLVKWQEKISCWFADHVITVTEAWRQTLIERGVPAAKCSVVMNLPDPHVFQIEENGSAQPLPYPNSLTRLFYHGNVTYRYGLDILVKAFAQVHQRHPNTRLIIHGRGDYQLELENLIDKLGLNQVVTLSTGLIPFEDLPALIKSADLAVVPNRRDIFTDGILPTKLMEYAALGMPTIASGSTAIRAYFDEEMVHFVPDDNESALAEAIIEVVNNRQKLRKLSENIKRFNQTHNWYNEAKAYVRLVENLIDKRANLYNPE
jgi:glycosyltransferase involved in cell wall biosynthesis